jgi:hypothetical protein
MIAYLNNAALRDLADEKNPKNNNFGIPQAYARFLLNSLNLKPRQVVLNNWSIPRDNYCYLVNDSDFWGLVISKELYEN